MLKIVGLLNLRDFVSLCSVSPSALADIERIGSRFLSFFADLSRGMHYNIKIMCIFAPENKNQYTTMPEISKFFGIIVSLYWRDHNPPHIHFTYGDYECSISVLDRVVDGKAPSKVIAKVNEWMNLHEAEILTLWEKAQKGEKIGRIEPLK